MAVVVVVVAAVVVVVAAAAALKVLIIVRIHFHESAVPDLPLPVSLGANVQNFLSWANTTQP